MQPSGISRSGATSRNPDHAKAALLENAPDAGQQMIVAAAEGADDIAEQPERCEVDPDLRERRPYQRADEDQVPAAFFAKQPHGAAKLANRNPAVTEFLHSRRIAGPPKGKQHRCDAAGGERVGNRERHRAAACDHADRR
ncbi:hypothetical protein ACVWWK_005225 [Bradyrhizobium sp. LB9.1b]